MSNEIEVRPSVDEDLRFVFATWLRDLRRADGGPLADDLWFDSHRAHIKRVLADPAVQLLVLCPTDDRRQILGYIVAEPDAWLHWVYLKPRYRTKYGLCLRLLEAAHVTDAPAAFSTPDARSKLLNPRRPRLLRQRYVGPRAPLSPQADSSTLDVL